MTEAKQLIAKYYDAFNRENTVEMLSLLAEDVIHDINQGEAQIGLAEFRKFMDKMNTSYKEMLTDMVIFTEPSGKHAAAEFIVNGTYLRTDEGLPQARGQKYRIKAGAFFDIENGKIKRVTNYYNLPAWIAAVQAQ